MINRENILYKYTTSVQINNVGVAMHDDIEHTSLEHFDTIMNTNVRGPFYLTMLAVPNLIKTKGI